MEVEEVIHVLTALALPLAWHRWTRTAASVQYRPSSETVLSLQHCAWLSL